MDSRYTQRYAHILLYIVLAALFSACPHMMIERIEKLLPPQGYKPRYMHSSVPLDSLAKKYQEAVKQGTIDTTLLYDDAALSSDSNRLIMIRNDEEGVSITDRGSRVEARPGAGSRSYHKYTVRRDSLGVGVRIEATDPPPISLQIRSLDDKHYPDSIEIRASVLDSSGRAILGLAPPNFRGIGSFRNYWRALQDSCGGVGSTIDSFTVREVRESAKEPYAIAFVIDHSGSMGRMRIRKLREAVKQTMNIVAQGDMVCVLPFAGSAGIDVKLSSDSAYYKNKFNLDTHAVIRGGTAIHDAVASAVKELSKAPPTHRKAVLLFTDGDDTKSSKTMNEACRMAHDSNVAVYTVAYGITNELPLQTLSRLTKGTFYRIYSTKEFPYVFADIYRSLKNYYRITYKPPPCKGLHHVLLTLSARELGVKRLSGRASYDKSLFTELDTVGTITFINIEFETAKATVRDESMPQLEQIAAALLSHPGLIMEIRGHTDDRGTVAFNQSLSQQRADAVADILIRKGVSRSRLRTKGFGSAQPLVANDGDENRAKNRRTEFVIVGR